MTSTVLLIRHAQTEWNEARRWQGHADIELDRTGHLQANALAERLQEWPIKAIYSSDLRRAADTARPLARRLGLDPTLDSAWRERHGGDFQGRNVEELEEEYPLLMKKIRFEGANPPNGESALDVAERVTGAFERILDRHHDEMVAVVTHGGALNLLLAWILGLHKGQSIPVALANSGLSMVKANQDLKWVALLNDTCHLKVP